MILLIPLLLLLISPPVRAEIPLRDMATGEDFRLGPVFQGAWPIGIPQTGDRQLYQLELRGESPNHGSSRISLRAIGLYELLDLPSIGSASSRKVRFHHQFITVGLSSPLYYEVTREYQQEFGWLGGFSLAQVSFTDPNISNSDQWAGFLGNYPKLAPENLGARPKLNPTQADAQFAGAELGGYMRDYRLYPLVPYITAAFQLGSFFDRNSFINGVTQTTPQNNTSPAQTTTQRFYQSGFRFSPTLTVGSDFYFNSRGLLGLEYRIWNWDMWHMQDWTHFISLKAGFLF